MTRLAEGVNVVNGAVTYGPVAEALEIALHAAALAALERFNPRAVATAAVAAGAAFEVRVSRLHDEPGRRIEVGASTVRRPRRRGRP